MSFDDIPVVPLIAVIALISPIITAIINNIHQAKIRKLELEHDKAIKKIDGDVRVAEKIVVCAFEKKTEIYLRFAKYIQQLNYANLHEPNIKNDLIAMLYEIMVLYSLPDFESEFQRTIVLIRNYALDAEFFGAVRYHLECFIVLLGKDINSPITKLHNKKESELQTRKSRKPRKS